jgi:ligand-binding sensor domain-containing protein/two-component sensor histidine kinase
VTRPEQSKILAIYFALSIVITAGITMGGNACAVGLSVFSLVTLLIAPSPGQAQRLPIRTYTTADGLASTFIQCIARDSRGFLWFCTRNGLTRFDGQRFVTYGVDDGLPTPTVNDFLEARDGSIWVATNGGGVCRLDPSASRVARATALTPRTEQSSGRASADHPIFTTYAVGQTSLSNRVNSLYQDETGTMWAGSDSGLYQLRDAQRARTFQLVQVHIPRTPDALVAVTKVVGDKEGNLWIASNFGLTRQLPDGRMLHQRGLGHQEDRVHALSIGRDGRLWAATDHGVIVLHPTPAGQIGADEFGRAELLAPPTAGRTSGSRVHLPTRAGELVRYTTANGLADNAVRSFYHTPDGHIWIATSGGLTEFSDGRFRSYTKQHGLPYQRLESVSDDGEGNLWIGTFGGVMKLTTRGFSTFDSADGLGDHRIHSIFGDEAGNVFVVNGEWILSRFDGRRFRSARARMPDGSHLRWASPHGFLDHTGQFWMFSNNGLSRFKRPPLMDREPPLAVYTKRDGLPGDEVNRMFEDSRGDLWISVASDKEIGLARWNRSRETFHSYSLADGFSPPSTALNYPSAFAEDRAGNIWIGFDTGGIVRYADGRFTTFTEADGIPAGRIMALFVDRRGRLWIGGTEGGLARLDDPTVQPLRFAAYTTIQGLASNNVRCITEDAWGRLYVGSSGGVDRLDSVTGRIRHFTTAEGLASDFVTAAFADREGQVWFGTLNGLSRLVPAPDPARSPPPVLISGMHFSDVEYPVSVLGDREISGIQLGANQNRARIDFFGLRFGMGEVLRYQFKLEGIDRDWGPPTDQRTVYYPSLPAGIYRFAVRAVDADGTSSVTPAIVAFTISPPVWKQRWFIAVAALCTGFVLYTLYRYRVNRLLEIERVRTRIATDLHDDIGSNLSQIAILSEVLLQDGARGDPKTANTVSLIAKASRESVDSLSDIVWAINPRRDSLRDLTQRMRRFASDTLTARNIEFTFNGSTEDEFQPGANLRQQVFLIFKETITNIARHSSCTHATIDVGREGSWLMLRISDNGKGLDASSKHNGDGLASMQARARALHADLDLTVAPGMGTTMRLRVPLNARRSTQVR